MATKDDEQTPLTKKLSDSNSTSNNEEEDEEEEKSVVLKSNTQNIPDTYQNPLDIDYSNDSNNPLVGPPFKQQDVTVYNSSFLICRITIFMYAFVSCLVITYFPSDTTQLNLWNDGWFIFAQTINVLSCILGMIGVYLHKTKLIFCCWIILMSMVILIGLLTLLYLFDNRGLQTEAEQRCTNFVTVENCLNEMKTQLYWTVSGIFIVYVIVSSFGIHIIRDTEKQIGAILDLNNLKHARDNDGDNVSIHSDDSNNSYEQIPEPNEYDINLNDVDQKKNQ